MTERAVTGSDFSEEDSLGPAPWEADGLDPRTSLSLLITCLSQLTRTAASLAGIGTSTNHPNQASPGSKMPIFCSKGTRQRALMQSETWPSRN